MVDFLEDLRTDVMRRLDQYGVKYRETMDLERLSILLFTFLNRYIDPHRRQVFVSRELTKSLPGLPAAVQQAVEKMRVWISEGVDVNCFQSRGLYSGGNRDYQGILYGVVHLHLSARREDQRPAIKKDGFAKPSEYVLYAYFTKESAYLLMVVRHPANSSDDFVQWVRRRQLEIMLDDWPGMVEKRALKGFKACDGSGQTVDLRDEDIAALIKGHINMPICVREFMFFPERGIAASGDDALAVRRATYLHNMAAKAQLAYEEKERRGQSPFSKEPGEERRSGPALVDVHLVYSEEAKKYVVMDRLSGRVWDPEER